jgi:spore germination protein
VVPHKPGHLNVYSAAYDLSAISAKADLVTLMAYDEHTSLTGPGAVAGLAWDQQVLGGSLPEVRSPGTVLLGLPLYARTWAGDGGVVADSYAASVSAALSGAGARIDYDFGAATPFVHGADGASTTYFDDADSLAAKLALVAAHRLRGVALWRLGFEDPAVWEVLAKTAPRA